MRKNKYDAKAAADRLHVTDKAVSVLEYIDALSLLTAALLLLLIGFCRRKAQR